jgi:hypothetical protein
MRLNGNVKGPPTFVPGGVYGKALISEDNGAL